MIYKYGLFVNIPVRWKVVSISISVFEANNFQLHKKKGVKVFNYCQSDIYYIATPTTTAKNLFSIFKFVDNGNGVSQNKVH